MFKNTFYLFFSISVFSSVIFSEEMPLGIFVSGEDSAAATPTQGISIGSGGRFLLRLHTACFPTNLRSVSNPIAPSSMIKAQFDLTISDQKFNFFVNFPGNITTNTGMKSASITPITKEGVITYSRPGGFQVLTCTPTMGGIGGGFFGIGGMGGGFNGIGGIGGMGGGFGGIGGLGGGGSNSCTQAGYTYSFMKGYTKTITLPPIVTTEPFINHNLPNGSVAGIYGNTVQMYINAITALSRNPDGSAAAIKSPPSINSYSFNQKVMDCSKAAAVYGSVGHSSYTPTYACGAYMAKDGAVSASVTNFRLASDNSSADLTVSFPGQTGFCGGYWSPLMIFLDEKRPQFNHISDFPLNPAGRTSWVEPNSPGYFLVYDEKMNGVIDSKNQLFGNSEQIKNGFEKLAQFDSNHDKFISKKDKLFSKLFLWNDKNGNGISEKGELIPLGKKVSKISLNYLANNLRPIGKFAEERESAKVFYFKNKKVVIGEIVDVWLAPQPNQNVAGSNP